MAEPARYGLVVALVALVITGCGGGRSTPTPGESALAQLQRDQNLDYTHMNCHDFTAKLTDQQRSVSSFEALRRLRQQDGNDAAPTDSQVNRYIAAIDTTCQVDGPQESLVQAAVKTYQHEGPF